MGAIVEIETDKAVANQADLQAVARELAMHVVSAKPTFLTRDDISAEVIENERRIELGKADLADKKPEMKEKIVTGRVDKLLAERVLSEQPFVNIYSKITPIGWSILAHGPILKIHFRKPNLYFSGITEILEIKRAFNFC